MINVLQVTPFLHVPNIESALKELPSEDVQLPVTKPWNQRELWVRVPDGN